MRFKVVLEPDEEGGYTVYVPSLPGCISEGDKIEDALANVKEAIELYLEPADEDLAVDERAVVREIEFRSDGITPISRFTLISGDRTPLSLRAIALQLK